MTTSKTYESNDLLRELRDDGAYSDLTIKCGDAEFRVHKCIVCPQSTFFRNACEKQKWKEGDTGIVELKAAQESTPDVGDDDPRAVKLMVDYLYLHDYDPKTAIAPVSVSISEDCKDGKSTDRAAELEQTVRRHQSQSGVPVLGDETKMEEIPVDETVQPSGTDDPWGFGTVVKKVKKEKKKTKRLDVWELESEPVPEPKPEPMSIDYHLPTDTAGTASTELHGRSSFLEMHAKVFATASKYDVRSLEYDARKKFKDQTQRSWEIADLIAAIHVVFNLTPDSEFELRNILKDTMVGHALKLVQHPDFEDAVASIDGLAYDLFRRKTYTRR